MVDPADSVVEFPPMIRRSTRQHIPPGWHNDFVMNTHKDIMHYPIANVLCYDGLCAPYKCFLNRIAKVTGPKTFVEVADDPHWVEVMALEIKALEENSTRDIVDMPKGQKAIGCK